MFDNVLTDRPHSVSSPSKSPPRPVLLSLTLALAVLVVRAGMPSPAFAQEGPTLDRAVQRSFHGPDGTGKDGPMARVGPKLIRLYHAYQQHQAQKTAGPFESTQPTMPIVEGTHVVVDAVARRSSAQLREDLESLGLRNGATVGRMVSGLLPIGALKEAARLASLHSAAPSVASTGPPSRHLGGSGGDRSQDSGVSQRKVGNTTTEGDLSLHADRARQRFGVTGAGIRTCALSDSYDSNDGASTTAFQDVRSGDLPGSGNPNGHTTAVDVLDEFAGDRASDEGRAMLQIIHDVAPGAPLGFHTAFEGLANFAQGVRDLANTGCEVIVDDIFYVSQPMFQDGFVSRAIEQVTAARNVSYFTAAGNSAETSYAAPFENSGRSVSSIGLSGSGTLHDFNPDAGVDVRQRLRVPAGARISLSLQWDDPYFRLSGEPGADTDLDVYLLDGDTVIASATRDNVGGDPWEFLEHRNDSGQEQTLDLAIALGAGPEPGRLKYINFSVAPEITEYATESPTAFGHSDATSAVSVGAAVWANTPRQPSGSQFSANDPPLLNGFSSLGGMPLFFDENGRRLSPPIRRMKPDLTAPDGVNTTFFGVDFDDDGFPNFFGTSAAAPHAAAVTALMREVRPQLPPKQIESLLERSAVDIAERAQVSQFSPVDGREGIPDGEGDDRFSGTGLVRADRAVQSVLTAQVANLQADGEAPGDSPTAPVVLQWQTVFERNSEGFLLERRLGELSTQARRTDEGWKRVRFVPSMAQGGASNDSLQYRFEGTVPTPGLYAFRLRHVTASGPEDGRRIGAATDVDVPIGGAFSVGGPQPNPSRGAAEIEVVVETGQDVRVVLYDALGRRVQVLHDDFLVAKTPLLLRTRERRLASGTYFVRVRGEEFTETRKMIILR